jgi:hypothetical protein
VCINPIPPLYSVQDGSDGGHLPAVPAGRDVGSGIDGRQSQHARLPLPLLLLLPRTGSLHLHRLRRHQPQGKSVDITHLRTKRMIVVKYKPDFPFLTFHTYT